MVESWTLVTVDGEVAVGTVRTADPDLAKVGVGTLALGLWIGNDHPDTGQQLNRDIQTRVKHAKLGQHAVQLKYYS